MHYYIVNYKFGVYYSVKHLKIMKIFLSLFIYFPTVLSKKFLCYVYGNLKNSNLSNGILSMLRLAVHIEAERVETEYLGQCFLSRKFQRLVAVLSNAQKLKIDASFYRL